MEADAEGKLSAPAWPWPAPTGDTDTDGAEGSQAGRRGLADGAGRSRTNAQDEHAADAGLIMLMSNSLLEHLRRRRLPSYARPPVHRIRVRKAPERRVGVRLSSALRTIGNPDYGRADMRQAVYLCSIALGANAYLVLKTAATRELCVCQAENAHKTPAAATAKTPKSGLEITADRRAVIKCSPCGW